MFWNSQILKQRIISQMLVFFRFHYLIIFIMYSFLQLQALQYTLKGGKKIRGLTASKTYEAFVGPEKLTPKNIRFSGILGMTMEMVSYCSGIRSSKRHDVLCRAKDGFWPSMTLWTTANCAGDSRATTSHRESEWGRSTIASWYPKPSTIYWRSILDTCDAIQNLWRNSMM